MREQLDAIVRAAADGVEFDGLTVKRGGDTYTVITATTRTTECAVAELRDVLTTHDTYVTNWFYWQRRLEGVGPHRYQFLRWLERADALGVHERYGRLGTGIARTWGQLLVTTTVDGDGNRRYTLRHRADEGEDHTTLTVHRDPRKAREIRRFDESGRYRPLKAAPTLPGGWVFQALSWDELLAAVEWFYPATIANWGREREGRLDTTHWDETAARQSGMYGMVKELPDNAVQWAADACCTDTACLKRRCWDVSGEKELEVPRGEGEFPCREACSLFIAAARQWTQAEGAPMETYELSLTPTEREQLAGLIEDAGELGCETVREGAVEDPFNRFRLRYLRAKLLDENGEFDETYCQAKDEDNTSDSEH